MSEQNSSQTLRAFPAPVPPAEPAFQEINERVRRRYIDRLSLRVRRLRRLLLERSWPELRVELRQLRESGADFGFDSLSSLATDAEKRIPTIPVSRLRPFPDAKQAVESLIAAIDLELAEVPARFN